ESEFAGELFTPWVLVLFREQGNLLMRYDLHPSPIEGSIVDTFKLKILLANEEDSVARIQWSSGILPLLADSAIMQSGGLTVNMLKDSVLRWDPRTVTI